MALSSYSKFYYGLEITEDNQFLDFKEGTTKKVATLETGVYTHTTILAEIARAFNLVGSQTYLVSMNRSTRVITISAAGTFSLLTYSGDHFETSAFPLLGFNVEADYATANSYSGETGAGYEYVPQYMLQSYVPSTLNQYARDGVVRKSSSGVVEAMTFGTEKKMECEIVFITNIPQPVNGYMRSNPTGEDDARVFMEAVVRKVPVEFIPDETKPTEFEVFILESTEADQNGQGFHLSEEYDKGFPGYYRSGKLVWVLQE